MQKKDVFINRILNMKKIKYLGLDMDHTLIRYNIKEVESLVYNLIVDRLITEKNYPEILRTFTFDFKKSIRGLVIDSKNGNILKLSRHAAIKTSAHGTKPISFQEQKRIYGSSYIDLSESNYLAVDTAFSIAFSVLYAQVIDQKDLSPHELPSYQEITDDILFCVDYVHKDDSLKSVITKNLKKYVLQEPDVVIGLERYKKHGKKVFLLTNSEFYYTKIILDYAINPFLKEHKDWSDLFDTVITLSNKPRFFFDNLKFLEINKETGLMKNLEGKVHPGIYQGGSAKKFTTDLEINDDEILYIGDHIYGDIVRLKKDCNWRTALVVEELVEEIESHNKSRSIQSDIIELMNEKKIFEEKHLELSTKKVDDSTSKYNEEIVSLIKEITNIDKSISEVIAKQQSYFNNTWGRIFRAGAEESYFAYQVNRFACIYMATLSCFLSHSPRTYFRSHPRPLPHEIEDEINDEYHS